MNYNDQVLQREHNRFLYLEEWPAPTPAPTAFEDAEPQITSYVSDYIADHDNMPDIDETYERFNLSTIEDYEALKQYFERERRLTEWKTPSLK